MSAGVAIGTASFISVRPPPDDHQPAKMSGATDIPERSWTSVTEDFGLSSGSDGS